MKCGLQREKQRSYRAPLWRLARIFSPPSRRRQVPSLIDAASKCSNAAEIRIGHCVEMLASGEKTLAARAASSRVVLVRCNGSRALRRRIRLTHRNTPSYQPRFARVERSNAANTCSIPRMQELRREFNKLPERIGSNLKSLVARRFCLGFSINLTRFNLFFSQRESLPLL